MGVKITKRDYSEIYTDGLTDWMLANVGEWQKLSLVAEASIDYIALQAQPVVINSIDNAFVLSNGRSWGTYGFDIGMTVTFKYIFSEDTNGDGDFDSVSNHVSNHFITNMYGSTIEVTNIIDSQGFENIPTNFGTKKITDVKFFVDQAPEGCRVIYGHITNDNNQTSNLNSFIDGTLTEFVKPEIGSGGDFMEAIGMQSGMSVRGMKIVNNGKIQGTDNVYEYEIEIEYMISSIFEFLSTFEEMEMPSYLTGDGSLTDNFKIEFYPEWNNPNVIIQNDLKQTERLGNTGWFNENYNELNNDFEVESIEYFDVNGNTVESLDYSSKTKIKAVIVGVPNLGNLTECGFGFAWIPTNEDDYRQKESPFYQNCYVQSGSLENGFSLDTFYPGAYLGAGVGGGSMDVDSVRFSNLNGKIVFEGNFDPNANFFSAFELKEEDDRNYIFWISVADGNLVRNFSDRVALLVDFNQLTKNIPPVGEYEYIDNVFLEHPQSEDSEGETTMFEAITQDGFLCRMPFRIPKDGSIGFTQMTFGVNALNLGLNKRFDLERYDVDLTIYPIDGDGVHQLSLDTIRGFKLNQGNNKNWVKIYREPLSDTNDMWGYMAFFATKIRWEDWLVNQDAPGEFFDATELNDGFHNDWIHYLRTVEWDINFFTEIVASQDGDLVKYENNWKFNFNDYDENTNVVTTHEYFRDSDDTFLNIGVDPETGNPLGVILLNEPTRIEIQFEIQDETTWDLLSTWGVMTIEVDFGAGRFDQRQLSSVWESENDNPLKPVTGEPKLKMEVDGTNKILTMSAIVDPDLLDDGARYRVTGRVGCIPEGDIIFDPGLYEFRYEEVYE